MPFTRKLHKKCREKFILNWSKWQFSNPCILSENKPRYKSFLEWAQDIFNFELIWKKKREELISKSRNLSAEKEQPEQKNFVTVFDAENVQINLNHKFIPSWTVAN